MTRREYLFWRKVGPSTATGCREWLGILGVKGYGHCNYIGERTTAHRIAYKLVKGAIPAGLVVMHSCDNRACCNPDHLSVGTQAENLADMDRKGRRVNAPRFGAAHHKCKLSWAQVCEIRRLRSVEMWPQQRIADHFRVSQVHVGVIVRRGGRLTC